MNWLKLLNNTYFVSGHCDQFDEKVPRTCTSRIMKRTTLGNNVVQADSDFSVDTAYKPPDVRTSVYYDYQNFFKAFWLRKLT